MKQITILTMHGLKNITIKGGYICPIPLKINGNSLKHE